MFILRKIFIIGLFLFILLIIFFINKTETNFALQNYEEDNQNILEQSFVMPLNGSIVKQKLTKEDNNIERFFENKFSSIGEAPVNAILPGKILKIEQNYLQDSLFEVTIYHGKNIYSKTKGLYTIKDYIKEGAIITTDSVIGFLPLKDTAFVFVEITRNGKYEIWDNIH